MAATRVFYSSVSSQFDAAWDRCLPAALPLQGPVPMVGGPVLWFMRSSPLEQFSAGGGAVFRTGVLHQITSVGSRQAPSRGLCLDKKVSDRIVKLLAIDPDGNRHAIVGLTGHTLQKTLANGSLIDPECHRLEDIAACAGECELQGLTMACADECELQGLTIDRSELAHLRDFLKTSFRGEGNAQVETETFYIEIRMLLCLFLA